MQKVLVQTVAALCLLPGAAWAQAQAPSDAERYYGWGPHMMGWGGGGYAMILGPFLMILFLAVLVALAAILARWLGWPGTYPPHQLPPARTALDILKERFARGEIDKTEFEDRRRVLGE
jgi:putative membrane protein